VDYFADWHIALGKQALGAIHSHIKQKLLKALAEIGNDEAPAEELIVWSDLYPIIDRLFDNFHTRLMQRFGSVLTDKEVQTCCLVCAGFSTKEIAVITRQAIASVYVRKTSARQKMGAPDGADIAEWVYQA
jgi:DNA-binding CsgD family transcriptional regulator